MLFGPDVSSYQGAIEWSLVRAHGPHDVAFAFAKATEGTSLTDPRFAANWHGIHEAGLVRGAYHFARPQSGGPVAEHARAEAEHMLGVLHAAGGLHEGDLPPVLDLEWQSGLSAAEVHEWAGVWVETVHHETGRRPIIYTGGFWKSLLGGYTESWGCPLWIAEYGPSVQVPRAWRTWTFWQYTDAGRLQGIGGDVDLSYFHGSPEQLAELAKGRPAVHATGHEPAHPAEHAPPAHEPGEAPRWPGRVLEFGTSGADVREWQQRMRERGFTLAADGEFGAHSVDACRWLQLYLGKKPTEQVDAELWRDTWTAR
ncbi:MAG TPA: GH25 family lysozyme [Thermoleophilaceae bacterium]|jgi:GH25 family lysozyme M1 (1,4-beta-N-acetylmuramidase)